jgi:hypothetical protein
VIAVEKFQRSLAADLSSNAHGFRSFIIAWKVSRHPQAFRLSVVLAGADLFPGSGMCMVTAGKKEGRGCCASVRLGGTFFELLRVLQFLLKLQKAAITTGIVV